MLTIRHSQHYSVIIYYVECIHNIRVVGNTIPIIRTFHQLRWHWLTASVICWNYWYINSVKSITFLSKLLLLYLVFLKFDSFINAPSTSTPSFHSLPFRQLFWFTKLPNHISSSVSVSIFSPPDYFSRSRAHSSRNIKISQNILDFPILQKIVLKIELPDGIYHRIIVCFKFRYH